MICIYYDVLIFVKYSTFAHKTEFFLRVNPEQRDDLEEMRILLDNAIDF
jgi:hypothetical protein